MGFGSLVSKGLSAASAVKSKISEIKSGIKQIKKALDIQGDITGLTYRNSLLYDFSSVVRARIYVFSYNSLIDDVSGRFTIVDNLPVQINPEEYDRRKSNGYKMDLQDAKNGKLPSGDTMEFTLKFNIVDEYKLVTRDGLYPIPLNLDEVTIISKLFKYKNSEYVVLFKWGPLAYLSTIVEVSCKYDSFSPYGEPLSAIVTVKFAKFKEQLVADVDDEDVIDTLGTANWAIIKGTDVAETVSGVVKSADAYSETLPNIARRI